MKFNYVYTEQYCKSQNTAKDVYLSHIKKKNIPNRMPIPAPI